MRHILLSSALCAGLFIATPAHTQDGAALDPAAAIEGFLTDTALLGADSATVGSLTTDGDTVTATDVKMAWSAAFEVAGEAVSLSANAALESVVVEGLSRSGEGHAAERIAIPNGVVNFSMTTPDGPVRYDITLTGYLVEGGSWGAFPKISADPNAPLSRFSPLVNWAVYQSYRSIGAEKVDATVIVDDETQSLSYGPMFYGPVVNGALESFSYGPITVNAAGEASDRQPVTITYGSLSGTGIDAKPVAQLLTGIDAADGPQTVMATLSADGMSISGEEDADFGIGPIEVDNFTIDPSRGPILEKLDPIFVAALAGQEPQPTQLFSVLLDAYGAYGFDRYAMSDIKASAGGMSGSITEIATENLSADGLGRFAITGVSGGEGESRVNLDAFEVRDLAFPTREALLASIANSMSGAGFSPQMMSAAPTVGEIFVRNFEFAQGGDTPPLKIGFFDLKQSNFINAIPTGIAITLQALELPTSYLDDPSVAGMMQAMGITTLRSDADISLAWTEETGAIALRNDVTVEKVGALKVSADVTGVPRIVFEDPTQAQSALATAAVGDVSVHFDDAGVTSFFMGMMSQQAGVTAQQFAQGIAQQVGAQISMLTGDSGLADRVSTAINTYLSDPKSMTLEASPTNPVPVAQLIGAAMTAPAQIATLLNFSIAANQ